MYSLQLKNHTEKKIVLEILKELDRAKNKHPAFVSGIIDMAAVVSEEAGEAIREALRVKYENGSIADLKTELIQTASSCVRFLEALENNDLEDEH